MIGIRMVRLALAGTLRTDIGNESMIRFAVDEQPGFEMEWHMKSDQSLFNSKSNGGNRD